MPALRSKTSHCGTSATSHSSGRARHSAGLAILADYLLARMTDIVAGMRVFPERMLRNLDATGGLVFSASYCKILVEAGAAAEDAYKGCKNMRWRLGTETNSSSVWPPIRDYKFLDEQRSKHIRSETAATYVDANLARVFS